MSSSTMRFTPGAIPTIANTIGALFVGWGASAILFGTLCLQAWTYFTRYPNDTKANKYLVAWVWFLEITHQTLIGHTCWHYLVSDFGLENQAFVEKVVWSLGSLVFVGALIGATIKTFFAWRVYKLSEGNVFCFLLIVILSVGQLGTGIAYALKSTQTAISDLVTIKTLGSVSLSLSAATDVIAALLLAYYLHKLRTGYNGSDNLINRLILFSVNTGALTSIVSLVVVVLYQLMPSNFIFIACYFVVCKLYSNSCLATFNSREHITRRTTVDVESGSHGPSFQMVTRTRNTASYDQKSMPRKSITIDVSREVVVSSTLYDDKKPIRTPTVRSQHKPLREAQWAASDASVAR